MGTKSSKEIDQSVSPIPQNIDFDDFDILRSIGKGSFGKVCIVKRKKTSSEVYAMKYMSKLSCWKQGMIDHVLKELHILSTIQHMFLVNLWFTFQDDEDIFMVSDLLLGGDLRYHIQRNVQFTIEDVKIYICEMASVLDYLQSRSIVHRDIKPDNILLDEKGHAHLTDFNIATVLSEEHPSSNRFAGTKPYAAPEVFLAGMKEGDGYSYSVDWWSLGVTMYEVLRHKRPFGIDGETSYQEAYDILKEGTISVQTDWPDSLKNLFFKFFKFNSSQRLRNIDSLCQLSMFSSMEKNEVTLEHLHPTFIPSQTHLNYDPTYELEELIIESNPLHKKKQRISKRKKEKETQRKKLERMTSDSPSESLSENSSSVINAEEEALKNISEKFEPFNRKWMELQNVDKPEVGKLDSACSADSQECNANPSGNDDQ